jgi:hypothetical protein
VHRPERRPGRSRYAVRERRRQQGSLRTLLPVFHVATWGSRVLRIVEGFRTGRSYFSMASEPR